MKNLGFVQKKENIDQMVIPLSDGREGRQVGNPIRGSCINCHSGSQLEAPSTTSHVHDTDVINSQITHMYDTHKGHCHAMY